MTDMIPISSRMSPTIVMMPEANISPSTSTSLVRRVTALPTGTRSNQVTGRCRTCRYSSERMSAMTRCPTDCNR